MDTDYLSGFGLFVFIGIVTLYLLRRWIPRGPVPARVCRDDIVGAVRAEKVAAQRQRRAMPRRMIFTSRSPRQIRGISDAIVCETNTVEFHHILSLLEVMYRNDWRPDGIVFDCPVAAAASELLTVLLKNFCPQGLRMRYPPGAASLLPLPGMPITTDIPDWYKDATAASPVGALLALVIDDYGFGDQDLDLLPPAAKENLWSVRISCTLLDTPKIKALSMWMHGLPALRELVVLPEEISPEAETAALAAWTAAARTGAYFTLGDRRYTGGVDPKLVRPTWAERIRGIIYWQ